MAQVKFYGRRSVWAGRRAELSDAAHRALTSQWGLPEEKRFHRFLWLDDEDLVAPRSPAYLVIEVVCFAGRSEEARRGLISALYRELAGGLSVAVDDVEVVILESPRENWGIRGLTGDRLELTYQVDV